jgi:hypothetical protein
MDMLMFASAEDEDEDLPRGRRMRRLAVRLIRINHITGLLNDFLLKGSMAFA